MSNRGNQDESKQNGVDEASASKVVDTEMDQDDDEEDFEETEFTLDHYRTYLSLCRAMIPQFALKSEAVTKAISDDFVELRRTDKEATQQTLHHRLLLMRLINCSFLNQTEEEDMMNILKYMQLLKAKRMKRNKPFEAAAKKAKGTPLGTISE